MSSKPLKVIAFNGSPRREDNTGLLISEVFKVLESEGIQTEMIRIGGTPIRGCQACEKCRQLKNNTCSMTRDPMNEWIAKAAEADAIILGSPTYFTDVTAEMKAFIDRLGYVSLVNGGLLKRKLGAAVVAVRRGGGIHVFDTINHLFQINGMIVVGATYWNLGIGRNFGEVLNDAEGIRNMTALGENIAWLLRKIHE
jgi:multimeric flavodoxin WrbA